jgi:flavin reductase (DIM6/NTAB) family NADH-FMN oxidoreductase RutF
MGAAPGEAGDGPGGLEGDGIERGGFDRLMGSLDAPMFVVTAAAAGEQAGCLLGFATQVSIDPSRALVCLSKANRTTRVAARATTLVVHVPRRGDDAIVRLFGEETGDEVDKFAHCRWRPGPGDVPVLEGLDWFAGAIADRIDLGDHIGVVLDVLPGAGDARRADVPSYKLREARELDPGHPS